MDQSPVLLVLLSVRSRRSTQQSALTPAQAPALGLTLRRRRMTWSAVPNCLLNCIQEKFESQQPHQEKHLSLNMSSHNMTKLDEMTIKTKKQTKCQPAARDTPDLIQTECVPDSGLSCQKQKKSTERKKYKIKMKSNFTDVTLIKIDKQTSMCYLLPVPQKTKTKKCQSAARDTPDLIQTECVPDSGLARQIQKKSTERKKYKSKKKLHSIDVTLANVNKPTSMSSQQSVSQIQKTKKCQPAAWDTPDLIQTECVPDSGLARQIQKKSTERKKIQI